MVAFIFFALIKAVGWSRFSRFNMGASLAGAIIVGSVVGWFGIAIPLILRGGIGTWAALKKSVTISDGYEAFIFLLVSESVIGSYVGWHATHYGLALVTPPFLQNTEWYGWAAAFIAVLAAAAVEPPLFIGLSLLADKEPSAPR